MPGETKEVPSAGTETLTPTKTKHQTSSSKAALARVTLLDGSILDVTIDRKAKGRDLINSICAGLNIQEKEYFGLIYTTPVDPRVWLDLDKPVAKFFKTDPWVLQFAVKFYPPEPAQLKEDITRYQLCLQVRNDILEGRLPCSFVTHALLGSYLVQSEMGDYDPKEMPDRSYLKDFKIAPNQAPDLEDKVMDLHKSHRGQSPAEAELHYLENAKKLALYGVDLHPAKDSEGVDIMLGVCSAGIFVHRDKLRINRFAWPKILKISYKRHHFYVKIRPGEFEQYESTIGFKLANHRAAKKLWKSCVEHHTFFRLMTPEQPNKAGLFPRFGSKYRYTGPTMAESRNNTLSRDQPRFDRTLSGRGLPSKSMDGIVQAEKERKKNDPKRQSLPPDSITDPLRSRSPLKNDKKEKLKRESSVGTASASSQSSIEGDYEPPTDPIIDDKKESPEKDKKPQKGVNGTEENGDKTPSRGRGGIFGSVRKSPKKDKSKEKEPVAVAVSEGSPDKSHTRPYEYSENELDVSPTRRSYNVGGFSYDKPNDGNRGSVTNGNDGQLSPNSRNKKTALAFNYAPEDDKLREHADKILYGQLSPKTKDKLAKGQLSPKTREKLLKDANLSPKTRRLLSGDGLPPKDGRSYSPSSPSAAFASGAAGKYTPIDGAGTKVVPGVALGGGKPKKKQVKIMLIVSKIDPKTKALDTENGHVEHITGLMDTETGVIDTKFGKIDPKKATLESYNPETNKVELFKGDIDGKTGNLHFTTGGVVDPRTGKVDNTLGEIVSIVPEENPVVELTCITCRIDPKTNKVDTVNGDLEYSPAVLDIENQVLHTKYGQIHLKTGELKVVDPKTGKLISSNKNVTLDPRTQQITINGVVDPKTGKLDPTQGRLIEVGQQIDPLVEVTTISGKLDSKKNVIDPKTADFEKSTGQYNPKTGKIDTKYGQLDLVKQTLTSVDPKSGKTVVKDVKIDPISGQVLLKNQVNPKTGKQDKDYGRIMSLKIVTTRYDPVTKKPILSPEDAIVDPVTNQIWTPTGAVDPITKEKQYVSSSVDPKTGTIITIYGYLNPKTNEIRKQTKIDGNLLKVDPDTGKIFTATGETDSNGEPLYATTEFDPATGDVYTKVGKVDPKTKKIVLVKILLLSKPDPTTGRPQEVDPDTCDIDPTTGRVTKFFNKTVYVYNMVDPITGDIIQVDPNDPRFAGAKTTVTQTMTLSGEVDPVTGRIKTEWGHIDPKTGDIDPKTAVKDPVTGQLILNYAQIDPSHFGKEVTITEETVPITREQFFDGIKHLGKDKIRRSSYASSDDDDMAEYSLDESKKQTAPTVVQTTTKQTITKTNDGVTHNVQEEIRNLGTGEVTISTQEHKVTPSKEQTPTRLSEPVVTAAVPKPSKQANDQTLAFIEGERYHKEPTYAAPVKKATETVTKVTTPTKTSPVKAVESSTVASAKAATPTVASATTAFVPEPLANIVKEKPVKVLSIVSKVDPKSKRIDIENGKIEQSEAKLNPTTGLIKTKYGVLNPEKGTLENISTKEVVQGAIDPKTGAIQFTNDPAHGQILSVVPNDKTFVELTIVSSKFEPNSTNINLSADDAKLEKCVGVLDLENGTLDTKYGQLCTKTGEIKTIDPKSGKVHVTKNAIVTDPTTGQIKITGLPDPKTGKIDNSHGCLIEIGQQIDPVVEVISVAGKMDKKGIIDPKTTTVETTVGQYNPETGKIDTKYGQLDLTKHTITSNDPKNNKPVAKEVKIDPLSGQITLKNILNPKNNKVEKDFGRILNVKIVPKDDSHKTGAIVLDSKTNQLWKPTGVIDKQYVSSKIDPKTGQIILVYGYLDPKTNEVQPITKMDDNIVKVDSKSGKLYTIIEESDKNGEPLYATTYVDQESGEVYTKVGKYDPITKTIVLVKIYLISKIDPATGKPQQVDPNSCTVDPESGRVTKFFNKTVYVYNMVDPITGEIIQVDPNDPRVAGAKTTVVQTLTLTGEIDPVTGRIKTEYGHIDPNTGDIDPATAVKDPVTGKLILNYADIDPSHFGKEVTVTKETVPITRDEFFEGIKKIEKNTGTAAAAGSVPTVVKTTTKQVITKTDDGVTHNLEEEVRNLGTGEVTYSTQEHKADASGNDTSSSGAYLQATAVTTRTATTHEDLGKKARTEQLEEKTVGTTRTYDPTKQEQRVVTQEVKTTVTATSGDQYTRRDSISSTSSGDSGTPIDGLDESYTTTSSAYKPSPHASEEPSRVVLGQTTSDITEGEIVSSQTVSSKTRTVETITYKTERDGIVETRVEQKITIQSDGDPIDHDKALAEAIQEATAMNPDMTVEKIEIQQQTQ